MIYGLADCRRNCRNRFGIVGNVRRIKIIIVMRSTDLASQCFITDYLEETIMILIILVFILFMFS